MPIINCPDCNKEISDAAPFCPNCARPNSKATSEKRPVSILLGIGILVMPIIFSWFTLRKGYSALSKVISFTWLVIFTAIISSSDKSRTITSTSSAPSRAEVKESSEKIMQVKIDKILSDYKNNQVAADNKYKGNLVQVTGIVDDVKKDIMSNPYVTLGTGQQFELPQVQAFFTDSMNNQLAQLNKGSKITVVCKVDGLMIMNVLVKDCLIK
jgi:hypothetical protein